MAIIGAWRTRCYSELAGRRCYESGMRLLLKRLLTQRCRTFVAAFLILESPYDNVIHDLCYEGGFK